MGNKKLEKDERALAVEKSSYFLAFRIIAIAVLCDVVYRSFVRQESPWDLLAIVIVAGLVAVVYQVRYKTWTGSATQYAVLTFAVALIIAAIVGMVLLMR